MVLYCLLVATLIAMYTGAMSVALLARCVPMMVLGHCLGYIGDHIPIWKDWLGGGALFTTIVASSYGFRASYS